MPDRNPLRPDHARFVELRLAGETFDAIARAIDVNRVTCFRWAQRADVRTALAEGQAEGRRVAAGILLGHAPRAAEVLGEALADPDASVRVRAAGQVLDRIGLDGEPAEDEAEMLDADTIVFGGVQYKRVVTPRASGHRGCIANRMWVLHTSGMPKAPASRVPDPRKGVPARADDRGKVIVADVPPDVAGLAEVPASPEEEAAALAWIRGEGPDPWADSD
jgi:hypothetical protein